MPTKALPIPTFSKTRYRILSWRVLLLKLMEQMFSGAKKWSWIFTVAAIQLGADKTVQQFLLQGKTANRSGG